MSLFARLLSLAALCAATAVQADPARFDLTGPKVDIRVTRGNRTFETLLIATEAEEPTPPCGMCRQVLEEFSPRLTVVSATRDGREARWTLEELLPKAFTPHSLDRR